MIKLKRTWCAVLLGLTSSISLAQFQIIPEPADVQLGQGKTKSLNVIGEKINSSLNNEAYIITLTPKGSLLEYATPAGKKFAEVSLAQLAAQLKNSPEGIPIAVIADQPQYPWRGMMIDVARHYLPLADLKLIADTMHYYKLNKLHLHLTDNQGWRLPVPAYPKLQTISSKRDEMEGNKIPTEGIYTKAELKELVKYCKARNIEIIPEIDVPGHNQALAAAYPEFFCDPEPGLKVRTTIGNSNNLICPSAKGVSEFYQHVFAEIRDIFPSPFVHLGGDEAPTDKWHKCPQCASWRKDNNLPNEAAQMAFFFDKMNTLLGKYGKKPLFWYENDASIYHPGYTVFTWRINSARKAVEHTKKANLNLILAPSEHCYFDFPQLPSHDKRGWMPVTTLEKTYQFDPTYGLPIDQRDHIKGVHCALWAEYLPTIDHVLYRAYPRAIALAEKAWSPKKVWSWENFQTKLHEHNTLFLNRFGHSLERTNTNEKPFK